MKKYLLLLPTLALIGAGCAGTTSVDTNTTAQVDTGTTAAEQQAEADSTISATATTNADGQIVVESDGVSIVAEPSVEAKVDAKTTAEAKVKSEAEIPVVEVVLGGATKKVDMETMNFSFTPNVITASPGEKIQITFAKNNGFHTFVIDELNVKFAIKQGESLTFTAPTTPGDYIYYCDVGSHRANGQWGTLTVK